VFAFTGRKQNKKNSGGGASEILKPAATLSGLDLPKHVN
jgi:hypothetical protein